MGWDGEILAMGGETRMRNDQVSSAYRRHFGELRRYLTRRIGCPQTAEDLTQETFIRLYRMQSLAGVVDLRSYLYRIAGNLMIDHVRATRAKSQPTDTVSIDLVVDVRSDDVGGEHATVVRDELRRVAAVVGELSESCGRIFWLSRAEGLCNYEIADQLGVCLSTVEKNINRAMRHCRGRLTESMAA